MGLEKLMEIGDKNQMMVTTETIALKWKDSRLSWDENHHYNISSLSLKPHHVWKPDIVLMNVIGGWSDATNLDLSKTRILLQSNGLITWYIRKTMTTSCHIQVEHFPFDTQVSRFENLHIAIINYSRNDDDFYGGCTMHFKFIPFSSANKDSIQSTFLIQQFIVFP